MYLKSLELQGFKSFPDRTLIRFGDEITAIVGPNGSGKSNISDALLWVMGEQSSRTLRGAKMEDVIFGGTQKRGAVGFAEATLTLDNSDRSLAYDADEVVVTRRYFRSGEGEYYINRQSARLKDINELLMDTGLGREGYSNIGQGRIDEILSLKSADRREIFEEAAGISKYRHRKEETEHRLAQTEDNLQRIGDKVSELELQLEPLKVQAEKAEKYLAIRSELRGIEIAVWLETLARLSEAVKKAEEDYASAAFVLQQAKDDLEEHYARSERLSAELREKDAALEDARGKAQELRENDRQLAGRIEVQQGNEENNRRNRERVEQELKSREDRSCGLRVQIDQARERVRALSAELSDREARIQAMNADIAALSANAQSLTGRFLSLRTRETEFTAQLADSQADVRTAEESLSRSASREASLQEDLSAGAERKASAQQNLDTCRVELRKAQEEAGALRNAIGGYKLRRDSRAGRAETAAAACKDLQGKLDSVSARARVFRAMEKDYENYQKSVRMVMQEAERGRLRNIHGPLSRLIRTEDMYTVAIEIALGGSMQDIVVDTENDAKTGIQYLKRTGSGRATFLPLSSVRGGVLREPGLSECHGFVAAASELITCEERYRSVVEYRIGRTAVVEDLDAAIAISRRFHNKFKIVTLDGQVINAGGSMTGGSTNRETGLLSRANELEKLSREESELIGELREAQINAAECRRQLEQADYEISTAGEKLREQEDRCLLLQGQEKQYQILLDAVSDVEASAQRERETLAEQERVDRERIAAGRAAIAVREEQLRQIRLELGNLENGQSEAAKTSSKMNDDLSALRSEYAALDAERNSVQSHIEDLTALSRELEGDRDRQLGLAASLSEEAERLQREIEVLESERRELAARMETAETAVREAAASRSETEAARTRTERETQDKNKDILNMERACALLEQKKVTTSMEEKQIVDKLWDTYELTPGTAQEQQAAIESVAAGNRRIAELRRKQNALGTPNLGAIDEYARVSERYTYLTGQRDDVLNARRDLENIIRDITREMTGIFVEEFARINQYFGQVFVEMFGGGKGTLLLEDPSEPLTCGIEICVQPPGKQVKTITLLSGGEKAFVATALYFAILKVRPTPFCLLDEIDAALDDRNVERFAGYLHNLSQKTQFIVITHRRGTMEAANILYGVTMQEQGVSKLLHLDLDQMTQMLGITE